MPIVDNNNKKSESFEQNVDNKALGPKPNKPGTIIIYISFILIIPIFIFIFIRNSLVKMQNKINEAASGIDVQLKKRRATLIKLVDATKQSIKFEKSILTDITKLRSGKPHKDSLKEFAATEGVATKIMATFEAYPDLKTTASIAKVMDAATDIENEIAATRRLYNSYVNQFNNKIFIWPSSIIAANMKLTRFSLISASAQEKEDVKINFGE